MRTITVKIETDSEESFDFIKDDIEQELSCCWNWFDKVEISEEMKGKDKSEAQRTLIQLPSAQPDWNEMIVICDCCGHTIHVKRQYGERKDGDMHG